MFTHIQPVIHSVKNGIFGRALLTDHAPLVEMLQGDTTAEQLNNDFPGFALAVVQSFQTLGEKRLAANMVTYLNFRVQAWSVGFDADGSPPIRVLPVGVVTDPNGSVTFKL